MAESKQTLLIVEDDEGLQKQLKWCFEDFYQKPVDTDVLRLIVDRAFHIWTLEAQNRRLLAATGRGLIEGIIGVSAGMQKACRMVEKVAPLDVSVLILGESGTGKELFARALHTLSPRNQNRFVAINCAAIPENLLESELFGYEKGAFTGAHKTTPGKIETAEGGTLFLDEIGDMPMALQSKLLRFLQERVVERVGGRQEIPVDVRVVCATHQDLQLLIAEGAFREDLYYRISEIVVDLPPLRDREGDISVLAHLLMEKCSAEQGKPKRGFSAEAIYAMERYAWPGNVRELENKIKTAVIMAEGNMIGPGDLGLVANGETDDDGRHHGPQHLAVRRASGHHATDALRPDGAPRSGQIAGRRPGGDGNCDIARSFVNGDSADRAFLGI